MSDPTTPPTVQEFTLTLRSVPSSVPAEIRMRRLLKAMLRAYGFRCVGYQFWDVQLRGPDEQAPQDT